MSLRATLSIMLGLTAALLSTTAGPCCVASEVSHIDGRRGVSEAFDASRLNAARQRGQARLRQAVEDFDRQLSSTPEARKDWHNYLKWESWASPLLESDRFDADAMQRIAWRLYRAEQGFEGPQVVELRSALVDLVALELAVGEAEGDLPGEFRRRMERLRSLRGTTLDFAELEEATWWLAATDQAPTTLAQVRAQYNQPAIVLQVHRDLLEAKLGQFESQSQEQRPTRNRIQGTAVSGTSNITSHTTAALVEPAESVDSDVRLRVVVRGTVESPHNVANSGRVRVASSSNSEFTVTADVFWDGNRVTATEPQASADTRSTIKNIQAPRLIRRAAERRVQGSRAGAEAEGEAIIEKEAIASMQDKLAVVVDKLNRKAEGFLNFVARTGNKPERWSTRVRPTSVEIGYLPQTIAGVAAPPHDMPPLKENEALGLSIHDAGLEAIVRAQLAGKLWTDVNFAQLQRELTGANTEELMIGLEPGRWSAVWDWRHPVRIHFTPEKAIVSYRFSRVEIDGSAYDVPFEVRAEMQVLAPPLGLEMRMLAPATVVSLDSGDPLPPHFQSFLERKFRGLFGAGFHLDGLQFPAGGALDGMSGFHPVGVILEPSWVHLRYAHRMPSGTLVSGEISDAK